jgi:hypothetical protein
MEKKDQLYVMGVDQQTYEELYEIAKREGKSVNDVTSDALRKAIHSSKQVSESAQKKVLNG